MFRNQNTECRPRRSSAARAIDGGADAIERVDLLVKLIADQVGVPSPELDEIAATVTDRISKNQRAAA